jgi:ABC-type oligopeptide transport system ATPase subunit
MSEEVINYYEKIPKKYLTKYHNPHLQEHGIKVPFRMLIVGSSGSMKTNTARNIISKMKDTFGNIKVICRNSAEPIYEDLMRKIPHEQLQITEGLKDFPNLDNPKDFHPQVQHLVIFDDLVMMKNQEPICEFFIRARKIAKGVSCMYLTQSYFQTNIMIRKNVNYIILKKLNNQGDLRRILKEYDLGVNADTLLKMYQHAVDGSKTDFLLIDVDAPPERRFRKNFTEVLHPEQFR